MDFLLKEAGAASVGCPQGLKVPSYRWEESFSPVHLMGGAQHLKPRYKLYLGDMQ